MLIIKVTKTLRVTSIPRPTPKGQVPLVLKNLNTSIHGIVEARIGVDQAQIIVAENVRASPSIVERHKEVIGRIRFHQLLAPCVVVEDWRCDVRAKVSLAQSFAVFAILVSCEVTEDGVVGHNARDCRCEEPFAHVRRTWGRINDAIG